MSGWGMRQVDGTDLRILGRKFREASNGAAVRKALTAAIQSELKPTAEQVRHVLLGLPVRGVRGGGASRRAKHHALTHKRAAKGGHGLRASAARAVKSRVSYSGRSVGAKLFVDGKVMPPGEAKLPMYLDDPRGWRHPVYGHKTRWVRQYGSPYWDRTIRPRVPAMRIAVIRHIGEALKELQR